MFKIYVFVYDISLQNVFIGSVLNRKKDIITMPSPATTRLCVGLNN